MNEGFKNSLIPIGLTWVALCLVFGLVLVVQPLAKRVTTIEKTNVIYRNVTPAQTVEKGDVGMVSKVKIQGTEDPSDPNELEAVVKIKN